MTLSDERTELVERLGEVLLDNHLLPWCTAEVLSSKPSTLRTRHFDVIIGVDCLGSQSRAVASLDALELLAHKDTRIVLCCEQHSSLRQSLEAIEERGWTVVQVGDVSRPDNEEPALVNARIADGKEGRCVVYEMRRKL